jgi:preprotein translocase subunit YajC
MFTSLLLSMAPLLAQAEGAAEPAAPAGGGAGGYSILLPMVIIGVLFYFMLIRPERKKQADMADLLKGLKKNDHVVTIGGIYGTVVNVQEGSDVITIRVDENTNAKLRLRRSAISAIVKDDGDSGGGKEDLA